MGLSVPSRLLRLIALLLVTACTDRGCCAHGYYDGYNDDDDDEYSGLAPTLSAAATSTDDRRLLARAERHLMVSRCRRGARTPGDGAPQTGGNGWCEGLFAEKQQPQHPPHRTVGLMDSSSPGGKEGYGGERYGDDAAAVLRCASLLRIVANDPAGANSDLMAARAAAASPRPPPPSSSSSLTSFTGGELRNSSGARGGCPPLHGSLFSSAVTLMRLRDLQDQRLEQQEQLGLRWSNQQEGSHEWRREERGGEERNSQHRAAAIACDEHVSIASELEDLGLPAMALRHLSAAMATADRAAAKTRDRGGGGGGGDEEEERQGQVASHQQCSQSASALAVHAALVVPHFFESRGGVARWRGRLITALRNATARCRATITAAAVATASARNEAGTRGSGGGDGRALLPLGPLLDLNSFSMPGTFDLVYMGYGDRGAMRSVAALSCAISVAGSGVS